MSDSFIRECEMRRRTKELLLMLMLATAGVIAVVASPQFQRWYRPPVADLPSVDDVIEMQATLHESRVGFEKTAEFVVPKNHYAKILMWLKPGEFASDPMALPDDLLGEIKITNKANRQIHIRFYWTGHNPTCFTLNESDYFWGRQTNERGYREFFDGGITLGHAINRAFESANRNLDSP